MGNAIEEQQAIRDNTTEGVGGLTYKPTRKEINARALEENKIKKFKAIDQQAIIPSYAEFGTPTLADFRRQEVRSVEVGLRQNLGSMPGDIVKGYGESKYDKDNAFLDDLTEHRASAQSFLTKAGNWLGQAGSTAFYSTIGGLGSIPAGLIYGLSNENGKGFWTNFIDNPFSQTLNKAQEQANDYFKFNLTEADEKAPWWKINGRWASGSAQAVGFVTGMIIPGMAATKLTSSAVLGSMKLMNRSTNFVSDFLKLTASEADEIVATAAKAKQLASVAETAEEGNRILSEIPKLTQQIAQTKKTADGLSRVIASGVNTSYEASIEALGTKDNIMNDSKYKETLAALDYKIAESKEALLNDPRYSFIATNEMGSFKLLNPEGQKQLAKVEQEVNNRKKDLIDIQTTKADSSMKQNYVINSLVVGASNYALFGRGLIDRFTGRKTLLNNITKADGIKVAENGSKVALSKGLKGVIAGNTKPIIKGISKSVASAIREGGEEAAQAFSNSFLQKYNLGDIGYHTFTEQVYNKESVIDKAHKAGSIWDNMKSAADETFSGDNMIGIMLGAAMGIVGIPITRKEAKQVKVPEVNEDGTPKLNELGQPLTSYKTTGDYKWGFSFHPLEEIKTIRKEKAEREALVDQINDRLEKKGSTVNEYFNDYFKNSNLKYVTEYRKTNALDGNDKKAFNDEQMTELIGDYVLFSKLGKQGVESLKSIPQQLANLSENTTSGSKAEQDQLKLVYELFGGKEVVEGGITHNDDGEVIDNPGIYNGTNPNDIFSDLKRKGQSILEDLDMINKNATNLKGIVDPNMSEDAFNELVYLTSRIDDFRKRGQEIGKIIDQNIKTVGLDSNHYFDKIVLDRLKTFENGKYRELFKRIGTDKSSIVKFALEHPDEYINVYNDLLDDGFKLTTEQKIDFKEKIKELNSNKVQGVKSDTLINLTNDLATIRNSRNRLMSLYTGIMENPEELEKTVEDIKNKFTQDIQDINTKVKEQSDINREINTLMDFQTQLNNSYDSGTNDFFNTVRNLKAKKYSTLDEKEKKLVDISDEFEQTGLLTGYLNNQIGSKDNEDLLIRSVFYGDKNNQVHLFNYNFKRFNKAEFDRYKQEMLSTFNNRLSSGNFNQYSENVKFIARKKLDHTLDEAWKEVNKTIEQIKIEHEVDTDLIVDPNTGKVAHVKTEPVVKEDIPEKPIVTPKTPVIKESDKIDEQLTASEAEKIADDNAARVEINKEDKNTIPDFNELPDVQDDNINGNTEYTPRDNMSEYMRDKDTGEYKYSDNFGRTLQPGEQDSRKGIFAYFAYKLNLFFKKDSGKIKLNPDQKVSFVVDMDFVNYELTGIKSQRFNTDYYPIFITTEIDGVPTVIGSLSSGGPESMYDILNKSLIKKYGHNGEKLPEDTRFVHVMKSDKEQYTSTIKQVYPSKYLFQPKNGRKRSAYYENLNSILTKDNTGVEDVDKLVVGRDIKFNFISDDLDDAKKGSGILEIKRDDGDYDTTFILTKKPSEVISKEEIDSLDKWTNTPLVHKVNKLIKIATTIKTKEDGQLDYEAMVDNVADFRYNQFGLRELFYLGTTKENSNITYNIEINILKNNITGKPMLSMIKLDRIAGVVARYSIDLDTLIEQNKDNTALQNIAGWLVENTDYFNFNRTSSSDYLKYLLDKGVFTTDLVSLRKKNMWFTLNDLSIEESKEFVDNDQSSELSNASYEALGLIDTSEIQVGEIVFNPDNYEADSYPIKINGKYAGVVSVNENGHISSSIGMAGVELIEEFQGKGYGTKVYIAVAEQLAKEGKTLKSEAFGKENINEAATRVWNSLLKKGYAIDKGSHFEIQLKNKQQAQQIEQKKQDIIEGKDSTSTGPKISFNNIFGMSAQNLKEISGQTDPINKGEETQKFKEFVHGKPNSVKPGVEELFDSNPELTNIGTQEQYSQYLDTIFPNSQVKDIVYHGGTVTDVFTKENIGKSTINSNKNDFNQPKAFYFTTSIESSKTYGNLVKVLINLQNPSILRQSLINTDFGIKRKNKFTDVQNLNLKNKDGFILEDIFDAKYLEQLSDSQVLNDKNGNLQKELNKKIDAQYGNTIGVFEPEQIHILGSKQDVEGFKKFVDSNQSSEQSNDSEIGVVKDTIIKRLLKDEENSENSITFAEVDKSLEGRLSDALKSNLKTPEELWSNLNSAGKIQLIDCL